MVAEIMCQSAKADLRLSVFYLTPPTPGNRLRKFMELEIANLLQRMAVTFWL
jgi:hypothetical protein